MKKEDLLHILDKNLNGSASLEEKKKLEEFLAMRRENSPRSKETFDISKKEKIKIVMYEAIFARIQEQERRNETTGIRRRKVIWYAAAAVVLVSMTMSWILLQGNSPQPELTYITKSTSRGQKSTITLDDGTTIRLNAESSITYPESFEALDSRNITLTGEAFFEVAKDEEKPFIVKSEGLLTTVLGTSFNVNAYKDNESIAVTVATGSVNVKSSVSNQGLPLSSQTLNPGQQGLFNKQSAQITKSEVHLETLLSWKDNKIVFDDILFTEAMAMLERWFDVDINYENPGAAAGCYISGKFKGEKLINILDGLKFLKGFDYQIQSEKKILITGKPCSNL